MRLLGTMRYLIRLEKAVQYKEDIYRREKAGVQCNVEHTSEMASEVELSLDVSALFPSLQDVSYTSSKASPTTGRALGQSICCAFLQSLDALNVHPPRCCSPVSRMDGDHQPLPTYLYCFAP
jgi:hypothetical protein